MIPLINGRAYDFTQVLVKIIRGACGRFRHKLHRRTSEGKQLFMRNASSRGHGAVTVSAYNAIHE
jgi:hypothetical protein